MSQNPEEGGTGPCDASVRLASCGRGAVTTDLKKADKQFQRFREHGSKFQSTNAKGWMTKCEPRRKSGPENTRQKMYSSLAQNSGLEPLDFND
jgi:hypothetical protein